MDVRAIPQFLSVVSALVEVNGCSRVGRRTCDIREKAIMHECGYLPHTPRGNLGEALVITQLIEEVMTVDDDELST